MQKKIAFLTDVHLDEQLPLDQGANPYKNWEIILADINNRDIDEIVFGGDIGNPSSHKYFFNSLNYLNKKMKIILGNHDKCENVIKYFKTYSPSKDNELFYFEEDENYNYFFLDTSSDKIYDFQLRWLETKINTNNKRTILFIHHPILSVDTPIDKAYPLKDKNKINNILTKHKSEVNIFCGHYHLEDVSEYRNLKQFVTPACSYQVVKEAEKLELTSGTFGYRIINLYDDQIDSKIVLFNK